MPSLKNVLEYYEINFSHYAIAIFHPVTTEVDKLEMQANAFVDSLVKSQMNYILIYPNNDLGHEKILKIYYKIFKNKNFRIIPSMRFEYFITLLKNAEFIIGNSSTGIKEAPYFGIPVINIGSRQNKRTNIELVKNCSHDVKQILAKINDVKNIKRKKYQQFGQGNSSKKFINILLKDSFWKTKIQKLFFDVKI